MKGYKTDIVPVEFSKLKAETRTNLETLFVENKVKFNYDVDKGEYVALLRIEKDKDPISRSKSSPYIRPKALEDRELRVFDPRKETHTECKGMTVETRVISPYWPSKAIPPLYREMKKTASSIDLRPIQVVPEKKLNVLSKYQSKFPWIEFEKLLTIPTIMGHIKLSKKIEVFLNRQFDAVQKKKKMEALNLGQVIFDQLSKKYSDQQIFLSQKLVSLLYSIDRYAETCKDVEIFRNFLLGDQGNPALLYFLYVRTFYKMVSFNFFLDHASVEIEPAKLSVTREQFDEISAQAFYFSQGLQSTFRERLAPVFKGRSAKYYDFMAGVAESFPRLPKVDLLPYVLALYAFKQNNEILRKAREKAARVLPKGRELEPTKAAGRKINKTIRSVSPNPAEVQSQAIERFKRVSRAFRRGEDFPMTGNVFELSQMSFDRPRSATHSVRSAKAAEKTAEPPSFNLGMPQSPFTANRKHSGLFNDSRVKQKYSPRIRDKDQEVIKQIRGILKTEIAKFVNEYVSEQQLGSPESTRLSPIVLSFNELFVSKLLKLMSMVFANDRPKFFELLRTDPGKEPDAFFFWENIQRVFQNLVALTNPSLEELTDFVLEFIRYKSIKEEMLFLMDYTFKIKDAELGISKEISRRKTEDGPLVVISKEQDGIRAKAVTISKKNTSKGSKTVKPDFLYLNS